MLRNVVGGPLVEIYPVNDTKQRSKLKRAMDGIIKDLCDDTGFEVPDLTKNSQGPLLFKKKSLVNRVGDLEGKVADLGIGMTDLVDSYSKHSSYVSQKIRDEMDNVNRTAELHWGRTQAFEKHCADQFSAAKVVIDRTNQRIDETNHRFSRFEFETVQFQTETNKRMDQSDKKFERLDQEVHNLKVGLADVVRRLNFTECVTGGTIADMDIDRMGTDCGIGDGDRFNGCSSRTADVAAGIGFTAYNALKHPSNFETNNKTGFDTFMDTDM